MSVAKQSHFFRPVPLALAGAAVSILLSAPAAALETRSYVVGWFTLAQNSKENDCLGGLNADIGEQYRANLIALGYSRAEADRLISGWQSGGPEGREVREIMNNRGRIDGKPVNAFAHPEAVAEPKSKLMPGKSGYGFNLDGKVTPEDFEDPQTGEKGVDNQLFRALGCVRAFRGSLDYQPTYSTWLWTMLKDSMPAWLISISGENLDADGPVTITLERALEHRESNANGEARAHMTYRADPDPRTRNVFRGQLKDGVVQIAQPDDLRLLKDPLSSPELNLAQAHLRLQMKPDGSIDGILSGYQPWREIYFAFAQGGIAQENCITGDSIALYYLLKKAADANPDPKTGENRSISASYRVQAVPAFVVHEQLSRN